MKENEKAKYFTKLLTSNQKRVYAYVLSMIPDINAADDIMQETSIVMWKKFDQFKPGTDFGSWAVTIAHFMVLTYLRKSSRSKYCFSNELVEKLAIESASTLETYEKKQVALGECIDKLNQADRELVKMRYFKSISVQEIATGFGSTVQNVYQKIARIERNLHKCVKKHTGEEVCI